MKAIKKKSHLSTIREKIAGLFIFLLFCSGTVRADHVAGANLTYKCLGGNQYEFTLEFYHNCSGAKCYMGSIYVCGGSQAVTLTSASCGQNISFNFTKEVPGSPTDITNICETQKTTCNGGSTVGVEKWVSKQVVTLPAACKDWVVRWMASAWSLDVNSFGNPGSTQCNLYPTIDNTICNSSPVFTNSPSPFYCVNKQYCINYAAVDPDGDSLVYSFKDVITKSPAGTQVGPVTYKAGYSKSQFVRTNGPITLDTKTGEICFTPSNLESGVLAFTVDEYRNGVKIGSIDLNQQIWIVNCNNELPNVSGINGTSNYSINACANQQLCFDVNGSDPDPGQTVTLGWNNTISGATFTSSGTPPTGRFCWTPTANDIGKSHVFTVQAKDNACPYYGTIFKTYTINVNSCGFTANVTGGSVCPGACTTVTASASGGTAPYTYLWSNGLVATAGPHNVCPVSATTYTVTITDNTGASSSATGSITMNTPATLSAAKTDALCFAGINGSATVTPNGGTSPYTYQWSVGGTQPAVSNLSAGGYTVTVTDNKGCTSTSTVTLAEPQDISVNTSTLPSGCGQSNGSATATVTGGSSPYTYTWSGVSGSGLQVSGLSSGTYTVTITDNKGCTKTSTLSVGSTGATTATITGSTNASCSTTNNGSATATGGGGTSPYTFSWSGGGGTTSAAGNLSAGTYTVTVTDATGCPATASVTITSPAAISLSTTKSDANCGGTDGTATVTVSSGGTSPYTYLWSGVSGSTFQVSGLSQGTYSVTVTDVNGCTNSSIVSVSDIGSPSLNVNGVNVTCNGQTTGSISSTVSAGVLPYTYTWSSGQTTANISNVSAGTYTLTVRGQNGCSAQQVVTITEPSALNLSTTKADASCGKSNGSVTVTASGGSGSYTYQWSVGSTQAAVSNIRAGNYTVTVTDNNGCSRTATESVADIGSPSVMAVKTDNLCFGTMNGSATATPTGGVLPYTYQWSGGSGSTQPAVGSLGAGTYTVTVTGNNGCTVITTVTINQPQDISLSIINTDELCGGSNGTATVAAAGGSGSYTYQWTGGGTQAAVSNLSAGTYLVTVTDANACTKIISTSVQNINNYGPRADFTMDPNETEILAPTIRFTDLSGGAATWDWNFGDGDSSIVQNPAHTYGDTGSYTVCLNITNQYGCASQTCKAVTIKPIWSIYIPNAFTPDGDGKNELFLPQGMGIQTYELYIFDRWGDLQFKSTSITTGWNGKANNGVDAVQEDVYVYLVLVTDINKKQHRYTGSISVIK